jgi:hypothetical protein
MGSIFIIIAESGGGDDYSTHNICAYADNSIAEQVTTVLNAIAMARRQFLREDLRAFIKKYTVSHPSPLALKQDKFEEVYPELPTELADVPKEERKGPEHEKYLQAVAEYRTKLEAFKTVLLKTESENQTLFEEWESAYNAAVEEFKSSFDVMALIPEKLKEQIDACLPYAEDADAFLVEEIDLLS